MIDIYRYIQTILKTIILIIIMKALPRNLGFVHEHHIAQLELEVLLILILIFQKTQPIVV